MKYLFLLSFIMLGLTNAKASELELTADQIVSVFENSSMEIQYDSIIDIHDGRGYTAGKAGFTTATGDLLEIAERYSKIGHSDFVSLIPILKQRSSDNDGNIEGLEDLPRIWKASCKDKSFIGVQDELVEEWYKVPAREAMKKYGISSNLGYVIFYDSFIQHGEGDDPDSFWGIMKKMSSHPSDEKLFLRNFLEARLKILKNPSDASTRDAWRESVDRVRALQRLIQSENWSLKKPFILKVWDDNFEFKH